MLRLGWLAEACTIHKNRVAPPLCLQNGTIHFNVNPFWKERTCPAHQEDGTVKCCACQRLCPRAEQWVTELDGRTVCLGCLSTIVRDTPDAQPLYSQVSPALPLSMLLYRLFRCMCLPSLARISGQDFRRMLHIICLLSLV